MRISKIFREEALKIKIQCIRQSPWHAPPRPERYRRIPGSRYALSLQGGNLSAGRDYTGLLPHII